MNQLSVTAPIHDKSIDTLCNTIAITSQDTFLSLPDMQINLIVLAKRFRLSCLPNSTVQVNDKDYKCSIHSKDNELISKFQSLKINNTEYIYTELNKYSITWNNITNQADPDNLHLFAFIYMPIIRLFIGISFHWNSGVEILIYIPLSFSKLLV